LCCVHEEISSKDFPILLAAIFHGIWQEKNTFLPPISAILARLHHLVVLSQPPKVEALKNATNTRRNKIAFQLTLYT
jgi:hypothetical protein